LLLAVHFMASVDKCVFVNISEIIACHVYHCIVSYLIVVTFFAWSFVFYRHIWVLSVHYS